MKKLFFVCFAFLVFTFSCTRTEPTPIVFDGFHFELPMKIKTAKDSLNLGYGYYTGFYKGSADDMEITTQIEGYPIFMGSDGDREESYFNDYFVGVSFFKENENLDSLKTNLETEYDKVFKKIIQRYPPIRDHNPFTFEYHFIQTEDKVFIVLREITRPLHNKRYISVSFYKGISEIDLAEYVQHIH